MSYLLILRRNQDQDLGVAMPEMFQRFGSWTLSLKEAGVLLAVERLKPANEAIVLSGSERDLKVEGRYPSTEDIIGYYLLNADLDTARAFAEQCPVLGVGGSVEIRQTEPFAPE
jgi:hypothetical protein